MVAWTPMIIEGSTSSSDGSVTKHTIWAEALKCYVCSEFYSKPRILPCGHTFCAGCLNRLRETAAREFNQSRDRNAHRRGDCGFFTCPWPNCHYSMKIMNVGRWTLKNKAAGEAVSMYKKKQKDKQDTGTQTDISLTSAILTIPQSLFSNKPTKTTKRPPTPTFVMDQVVQRALSIDSLNRNHGVSSQSADGADTWRALAAKVGLAVLDQILRQTF